MALTRLKDEYLEQDSVRFLMQDEAGPHERSDHGVHLRARILGRAQLGKLFGHSGQLAIQFA